MPSFNNLPQELKDRIFDLTITLRDSVKLDLFPPPQRRHPLRRRPAPSQSTSTTPEKSLPADIIVHLKPDIVAIETFLSLCATTTSVAKDAKAYFYKHITFDLQLLPNAKNYISHNSRVPAIAPYMQHIKLHIPIALSNNDFGRNTDNDEPQQHAIYSTIQMDLTNDGWKAEYVTRWSDRMQSTKTDMEACERLFRATTLRMLERAGWDAEVMDAVVGQVRKWEKVLKGGMSMAQWEESAEKAVERL